MTPGDDARVARRIAALDIPRGRPLIVCDVDEVLAAFMADFDVFLGARALYFSYESYRLAGNIRRRDDDNSINGEEIRALIADFFAARTEALAPVPGAAEALRALARRARIVVLSNIPEAQRAARARWLDRHGFAYPLVANSGTKGPAVAELAARAAAPCFFIDDSPRHHRAVAEIAADVRRLHFVADPRLDRLLDPPPECHHRLESWAALRATIEAELAAAGF